MEHWQETELEKLRGEAEEALGILMGRLGQRQGKPPLTLVEAARALATRDETMSELIECLSQTWKKADVLASAAEKSLAERDRLKAELKYAHERIAKLQDETHEVWGALDGDVEECSLVELAKKRWQEIEALRAERQDAPCPAHDQMNEALLRWAITQYQQGKVVVDINVREVEA